MHDAPDRVDAFLSRLRAKLVSVFEGRLPSSYRDWAEDLAQEALLKLIRSFDDKKVLSSSPEDVQRVCFDYALKIVNTVLADFHRKRLRPFAIVAETIEDRHIQSIRQRLTKQRFKQILGSLPPETIQIVSLRLADRVKMSAITEVINEQRKNTGEPLLKRPAASMRYKRAGRLLGIEGE